MANDVGVEPRRGISAQRAASAEPVEAGAKEAGALWAAHALVGSAGRREASSAPAQLRRRKRKDGKTARQQDGMATRAAEMQNDIAPTN